MRAQINHYKQQDAISTGFRDLLGLLVLALIVIVANSNDKQPTNEETATIDATKPYQSIEQAHLAGAGLMNIQAIWPILTPDGKQFNVDVDLWVRGPDGLSIGYSSQGSLVGNLLRDDLGNDFASTIGDMINSETIVMRVTPPGEYVINLHEYSNKSAIAEVPVRVQIAKMNPSMNVMNSFLPDQTVTLTREGDEVTVARFVLDEQGDIVPGSFSQLFEPIRALKKG